MKLIKTEDVVELPANRVLPGMLTIDGLVIESGSAGVGITRIEHRASIYVLGDDDPVQIFARLSGDLAGQAIKHILEEGNRGRYRYPN